MDILDKNIYETLISSADDKTVIQMLNANVNFRPDDSFFERLMSRKYPLLMRFKEGTWKQTYLKMIYYIAKLEEEHGIPYIPGETFNPIYFYKFWHHPGTKQIYSSALSYAAKSGDINIVKLILSKINILPVYIKYAIKNSEEKGYTEIADFLKNYLV